MKATAHPSVPSSTDVHLCGSLYSQFGVHCNSYLSRVYLSLSQTSKCSSADADLVKPTSLLRYDSSSLHLLYYISIVIQRNEKDAVHLQSGTEMGVTLGTPIGLLVKNEDQRPHDYSETDLYPRPSHADYTYLEKYGIKASSGGGRSSARETIGIYQPPALALLIHCQVVLPRVQSQKNISKPHTA